MYSHVELDTVVILDEAKGVSEWRYKLTPLVLTFHTFANGDLHMIKWSSLSQCESSAVGWVNRDFKWKIDHLMTVLFKHDFKCSFLRVA